MAEEKKEEIKKPAEPAPQAAAEKKESPAQSQTPSQAAAPAAEAKAPEATQAAAGAAKTEEAKKEEPKAERPANCVVCNKSIKKRWYYRNGKYYCTKTCWQTALKKAKAPEGEAKPQ